MRRRYLALFGAAALAWGCGGGSEAAPVLEQTAGLPAHLWKDVTAETIGETSDWSNKVELADLNGDGMVDLLFANGGSYREPGEPTLSRVFLNQGPGKMFADATEQVFGTEPMLCRVVKAADVNGDGAMDVFFGATYQGQSRLMLNDGKGGFANVSASNLPKHALSLGDAEFGDADLDGDLDLVLVDWGADNPMKNDGGVVLLWLNDGQGKFTPAPAGAVPDKKIRFSWDIEFADVDNDFDLDLMVSSKMSEGGSLYINDGKGAFTDETEGKMPQLTNNYEYEPIDLNGDGYLDTFTINDGGTVGEKRGMRKESVFFGRPDGGFDVVTDEAFPESENLGYDDNRIIAFDYDSDGDVDIFIGSLSGPDRLAINDGTGHFTVATEVVDGPETKGTLCIQAADLNGDDRLDLVMAQGEVKGHEAEKVYFGTENLPKSTGAPKIVSAALGADGCVRARIHANNSPTRPFDFESITLEADGRRSAHELVRRAPLAGLPGFCQELRHPSRGRQRFAKTDQTFAGSN
ncbi:MAG: VCBS repeat-containing protein [Bryobacterales bacterium]